MRYGSICSGIEAATVAWHPLGWEPAFFSEIEPFPRAVLKHHYPTVPLHGDFTTIGEHDYGAIDLLVGGTPCQDFSVAGLRQGITGERGNLTLEFIRLVARKKPRWMVWENVPGVLSIDGGRTFGTFLGGLAECGYGFAYRILDAQYFGVPQRRRRVFVIGYLGDWRPAAAVLFERESLLGDITPRRKKREGAAGTVTAGTARRRGAGQQPETLTAHTLTGEGFDASSDGSGRGIPLVPEIAWALQERDYKGADSNTKEGHLISCAVPLQEIGKRTGVSTSDVSAGIGIGTAGDPMFTLQSSAQHGVAIPIQDKATRHRGGGAARQDDGSANDLGVGQNGDPAPTITSADRHSVAFSLNLRNAMRDPDKNSRAGCGIGEDLAPTVLSGAVHGVASFKPGQSAVARGIGYEDEMAPSLEGGGGAITSLQ